MKRNYIMKAFIAIIIITIACGCGRITFDKTGGLATLKASSSLISIKSDGEINDFYYTVTSNTDIPFTSTKYEIKYKKTINGVYIPAYNISQNIRSLVTLTKQDESKDLKGISYASGDILAYMTSQGIKYIYADICFYFEKETGEEFKISVPTLEISNASTISTTSTIVTRVTGFDEDQNPPKKATSAYTRLEIETNNALNEATVSKNGFSLSNPAYEMAASDYSSSLNKIILTLTKASGYTNYYNTGSIGTLTYNSSTGAIQDASGNLLTSFSSEAIVDSASPVIVSAVKDTIAKTLTIKFSEQIMLKSGTTNANLATVFSLTGGTIAGATAPTATGDTLIMTLDSVAGTDINVITGNSTDFIQDTNGNKAAEVKTNVVIL